MRGKRPKIIDVDLLSDVSSPKCHSPKSPRIKEEELDDIEEMQVEAQVEEDVMGLSDAESDEVEEEEEASNVSVSDDVGDLGDSEGEEEDAKEEDPLPPIKVGAAFGKNLSKKDMIAEVFFCFDPFCKALLALPYPLKTYYGANPPNLQPITVQPLLAGVRQPSTAMHIQKVDTLGFPTLQTDWKNSTVAPSYPPSTAGNPVLKKNIFLLFF